jgi:hypothetical protein
MIRLLLNVAGNISSVLLKIAYLNRDESISPKNQLTHSYLYGFDEILSPNNLLVRAVVETSNEGKKET